MAKVTIRFVYERDYEIPDDMHWLDVVDALVNFGQVLCWDTGKATSNIFDKPVSKMRYVDNLYSWMQYHQHNDRDAWELLQEEETSDA